MFEEEILATELNKQIARMNKTPSMTDKEREAVLSEFGFQKLTKEDVKEIEWMLKNELH